MVSWNVSVMITSMIPISMARIIHSGGIQHGGWSCKPGPLRRFRCPQHSRGLHQEKNKCQRTQLDHTIKSYISWQLNRHSHFGVICQTRHTHTHGQYAILRLAIYTFARQLIFYQFTSLWLKKDQNLVPNDFLLKYQQVSNQISMNFYQLILNNYNSNKVM